MDIADGDDKSSTVKPVRPAKPLATLPDKKPLEPVIEDYSDLIDDEMPLQQRIASLQVRILALLSLFPSLG